MGQVNQPSNVLDQIRQLRRELAEVRKAIGLTSATIERGGLTLLNDAFFRMVDDNDVEILYAGPDDQGRQFVRLRREGGGEVLYTYTIANGQQYWALTDRTGRIIVSDDAESGTGLARPWLPVVLYPLFLPSGTLGDDIGYSNLSIANLGGETGLWEGRATISHPKIEIHGIWGQASGFNSTTYRLKIHGDTVGTWIAGNLEVNVKGPFDVAAFIGQDGVPISLTAAPSGNGNIACQVMGCYLRQS